MNIDRLFYILQKDGKIGEEEVLNIIDEEYLDYLLEKEILKQIDSDNYSIDNVENTFYFGRYFLKEKDYKTANRIFDCCYKMDPNNFIVNYQLFLTSLEQKKRSHIFKHFDFVCKNLILTKNFFVQIKQEESILNSRIFFKDEIRPAFKANKL